MVTDEKGVTEVTVGQTVPPGKITVESGRPVSLLPTSEVAREVW